MLYRLSCSFFFALLKKKKRGGGCLFFLFFFFFFFFLFFYWVFMREKGGGGGGRGSLYFLRFLFCLIVCGFFTFLFNFEERVGNMRTHPPLLTLLSFIDPEKRWRLFKRQTRCWGSFLECPGNFRTTKPFFANLHLKTERCIRLKLLVWKEPLFILRIWE